LSLSPSLYYWLNMTRPPQYHDFYAKNIGKIPPIPMINVRF